MAKMATSPAAAGGSGPSAPDRDRPAGLMLRRAIPSAHRPKTCGSAVTTPVAPPTAARPAAPARLPGLELLRLVAAVCVLLLHARAVFGGKPVFGRGYIGVDYFLMLSGFLMVGRQETALAAGDSALRFMWRRALRMWPMMLLAGLIGLPLEWLRTGGGAIFAEIAAANLLLLPVWWAPFLFPLNIPAWTVLAELVANACHVTALWRIRGRWIWLPALVLAGATLALVVAYGTLNLGPKPQNALPGLVRCLAAYTLGMALARTWGRRAPLPVPAWPALVAMPAWLVAGWGFGWSGWWPDVVFALALCPLMLIGALRFTGFTRVAAWAGRLAFPLFALQMPVMQAMRWLGFHTVAGIAAAVAVAVAGLFAEPWLNRMVRPLVGLADRRR